MKITDYVQSEYCENAAYETFEINSEHKYSFTCINAKEGFFCTVSFNSVADLEKAFDWWEVKSYNKLTSLEIGESIKIKEELWVRFS